MNTLILASSSVFRKQLLKRLQIPFTCTNPDIDETPKQKESAPVLVERLAIEKAIAVAGQYDNHLIIGADQVALLGDNVLTKPGNIQNASQQLRLQAGQTLVFYSGIALYNSTTKQCASDVVATEVTFRQLSDDEITRYLEIEKPFNCAGSFKSEGLGISLFKNIKGPDPTALVGLPLIRLCEMLRAEGIKI
ncbi:MAG: nucleoside triphosphate pyrophosphatase [Porticoccaceae bacterium]|nr:septum formation inhibitor Maf [Pseudomonadales bacterium]MCP5171572.1 septum formation inhibitor Maf [Pseudomonadales bacterium]